MAGAISVTRWPPARGTLLFCGVAIFVLALGVAAIIKRHPAEFAASPIALVRDMNQHPRWAIRLSAAAHLIAVDALDAPPAPAGQAYQLWLSGPDGPRSLGLLPAAGRKIIPETPALIAALAAGHGVLAVTLEPARGSATGRPSGPAMFRG